MAGGLTGGMTSGGANPLSGLDIGSIFINAKDSFTGLNELLVGKGGAIGLAELVGMILIALALFNAWKAADDQNRITAGKILSPLIIGGLFLSWDHTTAMVSESLALSGGALGYIPPQSTSYSKQVTEAVFTAIGTMGAFAIFRGLLKWKAAGEGENQGGSDNIWGGLWHIIGGGIAYNIGPFMKMMGF